MPKYKHNNGGLRRCQSLPDTLQMIQVSVLRHTDMDKGASGQVYLP